MTSYETRKSIIAATTRFPDPPLHRLYRSVIAAIPPGTRVLDVACGSGKLLAALQERGCTCRGLDIAVGAIESSRARGLDVLHGDADAFDSDPAIADLLFAEYDAVIFSKCMMYLKRKNELVARLRTKDIFISQSNPIRWKNILRRKFAKGSPLAYEHLPYVTADGVQVDENTLSGMRRWGASYGYSMRVLHGSFFRGRDMVMQFSAEPGR